VIKDGHAEDVNHMQVGLLLTKEKLLSITLNANIYIWSTSRSLEGSGSLPVDVIQGHSNYIEAIAFVDGVLISGDQDGKLFSWSKENKA
jgi:WD40 repeat protein